MTMKKKYQASNNESILEKLWDFRREALMLSISLGMIFFIVSAIIPASYKAFASVVINQQRTAGIDAYREAKSSEFMARTVKEMIMANSFMRDILENDGIIWAEMNKIEARDERIKLWKKRVKVSVVPNTGVLSILVYTNDRELSKIILTNIVEHLQGEKDTFLAGKGVRIEVINEPYYFHKQATPNLALNTILGFIVGLIVAVIIVLFKKNETDNAADLEIKKNNQKRNNIKYTELSSEEIKLFSKKYPRNFNFK
jgi:capsular polysaccharide biosynthesis protein